MLYEVITMYAIRSYYVVVWEELRVNQVVAEVLVKVAVQPLHHLVHACPCFQVRGIRGRTGQAGEIAKDGSTFRQSKAVRITSYNVCYTKLLRARARTFTT